MESSAERLRGGTYSDVLAGVARRGANERKSHKGARCAIQSRSSKIQRPRLRVEVTSDRTRGFSDAIS